MKLFRLLLCLIVLQFSFSLCSAQDAQPKKLRGEKASPQDTQKKAKKGPAISVVETMEKAGATIEVYKKTTDSKGKPVELKAFVFNPENHQASDRRSAIVFFFGGGWRSGTPTQFVPQCKYLAERGMVAITVDYRVLSRQGTKPPACVSDGKSAVRWVRENAERLGVDPNRVAAGGGSAGGHVAACTGVIKTLDEPDENLEISSKPNAMVLFNPALVLAPIDGAPQVSKNLAKKLNQLEQRIGADPKTISPAHNIAKNEPPTIIFHGEADKTVPYATAEVFDKLMNEAGNTCELVGYPGQGHGFFNANRKNGKYVETIKALDRFLVSQGFLKSKN